MASWKPRMLRKNNSVRPRCKEFLETHREIPPARFADIFLDSIAAFSGYGSARAQEDDITLVVLDFQ